MVPLDIAVCPRSAPLVLHQPTVSSNQRTDEEKAWHMSLQATEDMVGLVTGDIAIILEAATLDGLIF